MNADYYAVLGVDRDASADDIKAAYRKRSRETHPDAGGSAEDFRNVQRAYETLRDERRRSAYDEHGEEVDIDAVALEVVTETFAKLLRQAPMVIDVVSTADAVIAEDLRSVRKAQKEATVTRDRMESYVGRVNRRSDGENLFSRVLEVELAEARRRVSKLNFAVTAFERARELLVDYSFQSSQLRLEIRMAKTRPARPVWGKTVTQSYFDEV